VETSARHVPSKREGGSDHLLPISAYKALSLARKGPTLMMGGSVGAAAPSDVGFLQCISPLERSTTAKRTTLCR